MAGQNGPMSPSNAYELIKVEMRYWMATFAEDHGRPATEGEKQQEANRVVVAAEIAAKSPSSPARSWLRDLITQSGPSTTNPVFLRARVQDENRIPMLRINGKADIFSGCELETQLHEFVQSRISLGLTAMDSELQAEACRIIGRIEEKSGAPSDDFANFLIGLINSSHNWLADFRQRAQLVRSEDLVDFGMRSNDPSTIDSTVHNYTRLDHELGRFLQAQRSVGVEPSDADLQREARNIVYNNDDEWNQTAADDACWLTGFRQRHSPQNLSGNGSPSPGSLARDPVTSNFYTDLNSTMSQDITCLGQPVISSSSRSVGPHFLNDANCYRRLFRDLRRFVATTTSEHNPNRHVPTDEELQHQARWIVYDDDDPWNQTAADNVEWLQRFKRDTGLLPAESGPGLSPTTPDWTQSNGGTGFAPPYIYPNPTVAITAGTESATVMMREEAKLFPTNVTTTSRYIQNFTQRHGPPAKIFCSRELESGLTEFVRREVARSGLMPNDVALQQRACDIMSTQKTSCDDPVLLAKFKDAMQQSLSSGISDLATAVASRATETEDIFDFESTIAPQLVPASAQCVPTGHPDPSITDFGMDGFTFTEQEMTDILDEINPTQDSVQQQQQLGHFSTLF